MLEAQLSMQGYAFDQFLGGIAEAILRPPALNNSALRVPHKEREALTAGQGVTARVVLFNEGSS